MANLKLALSFAIVFAAVSWNNGRIIFSFKINNNYNWLLLSQFAICMANKPSFGPIDDDIYIPQVCCSCANMHLAGIECTYCNGIGCELVPIEDPVYVPQVCCNWENMHLAGIACTTCFGHGGQPGGPIFAVDEIAVE